MTREDFKFAIMQFIKSVDMPETDFKPGAYYFSCRIEVYDDLTVAAVNPTLTKMEAK